MTKSLSKFGNVLAAGVYEADALIMAPFMYFKRLFYLCTSQFELVKLTTIHYKNNVRTVLNKQVMYESIFDAAKVLIDLRLTPLTKTNGTSF